MLATFRCAAVLLVLLSALSAGAADWQTLAPGMELAEFTAAKASFTGDSRITVVRIDPALWQLEFMGISRTGERTGHTAREWCEGHNLTAAINAGMYGTDRRTHLGYLRSGGHVNNGGVNNYQSVAAFDPRGGAGLPPFRIFDLDAPGVTMKGILKDYAGAVQNMRLLKRPGVSVWSRQEKEWSEAALGEDDAGRILFIFCRSPYSMYDLNRELLASGIGLVAAQHLEGGPAAELYLRAGDVERELVGSYETFFWEDDDNDRQWPIPNVLGVRPRPQPRKK
jgi:hypothetical protein